MVPVVEIYRLAGNKRPAKKEATMHLGIALPFGDIGGDGPIVREYAELAEAEGYEGLTLADHVLGGNPANPASGRAGGLGLFHDPFVAFGFIAACTKKVELSTQVLILAQRQTVLVAKQLSEPPGPTAVAEFDKLRRLVEAEGRDPASVCLEVWTS